MIVYPAKYIAENEKLENTPATIVEIVTDGIEDGTSPGDQLDINGSPTSSLSSGVGHLDGNNLMTKSDVTPFFFTGRQSFIFPSFRSGNITSAKFWMRFAQASFTGSTFTGILKIQFFRDINLVEALTELRSVAINFDTGGGLESPTADFTVSFSGETFNFLDTITYYIKVTVSGDFGDDSGNIQIMGTLAGGYSDGEYVLVGAGERGDLDFTLTIGTLFDNYLTPKNIEYDLDLGEVPVNIGEWVIKDTGESGTSSTYTAVSDDNAGFTSPTSLGTIEDGDEITTLERFYRITATLATTVPHNTPTVVQIKAVFEVFLTISDTNFFGHSTDLKSVSTITKTIDDFKASTIGQLTFVTDYSPAIRSFLETKFPKGNTVKFKRGFVSPTFTENDFIDHYLGRIENWVVNGNDTVTFTLKDFQRDLSTKIPIIGTDGETTNISWDGVHPVTVMLDIIQNRVGIRTSKVDVASFDAVVTALSGWVVTRNDFNNTELIDPEEAQKLLEELRIITNTYFIPQNDGRIVLKQWDPDEDSVRTFLEQDFLLPPLSSDANLPALFNFVLIYYDWDGDGNEPSDFTRGSGSVDATSLANWGLTEIKQLKDKWTLADETSQIETVRDNLQNRYKDPPKLVSCVVDSKNSDLEVGDVVSIIHPRNRGVIKEPLIWAAVGETDLARSAGVFLEIGESIFIFGGFTTAGLGSDSIVSSSISGEPLIWNQLGTITGPSVDATGAVIGDNVYLFGGQTFNPPNQNLDTITTAPISDLTNWSSAGNLPADRSQHAQFVGGGFVYLLGGSSSLAFVDTIIKAPISDLTSWSSAGNLSEVKARGVSIVINEELYIMGGLTNGGFTTDTIIKAPISDLTNWSSAGNLPTVLMDFGIYKTDLDVYIFGGRTGIFTYVDTIFRAPISDLTSWSNVGTLNSDKSLASYYRKGDFLYSFYGETASGVRTDEIARTTIIERRMQIVSVNPTTKNRINLKLLGMGV